MRFTMASVASSFAPTSITLSFPTKLRMFFASLSYSSYFSLKEGPSLGKEYSFWHFHPLPQRRWQRLLYWPYWWTFSRWWLRPSRWGRLRGKCRTADGKVSQKGCIFQKNVENFLIDFSVLFQIFHNNFGVIRPFVYFITNHLANADVLIVEFGG